jgi:hypothetical protein
VSTFRTNRHRSLATALLLLASFCTGPLVLPHADPLGDPDCGLTVVHDESSHRIGGASSPDGDHPPHCLLCHWARAFCSLLPTGDLVSTDPTDLERLHPTSFLPYDCGTWSLHLGRAPPA